MDNFQVLLLNVWREACRHIEIRESVSAILPLLAGDLPIERMLVLRISVNDVLVETVADVAVEDNPLPSLLMPDLGGDEVKNLIQWCSEGLVVHLAEDGAADGVDILRDAFVLRDGRDVVVGPLSTPNNLYGVLVVVSREKSNFRAGHLALIQELIAPFSAALENDHRLREMDAMRAAAEADKQTLLNKLGRREMGDTIVGAASGLHAVMERVELVARSNTPTLIFGETGSGKELVARAIHHGSPRLEKPFIRVNCGAIPSELIDSELFGHEKGAFTGAIRMRQGWFERANGGTLFLDEIGDLPLAAQVRLLRVLQDGWFERVGGHEQIHVDVRIVAATNCDLAAMVRDHRFREDLWYRLAVFPIMLPPLRERPEDIAEIARYFAERASTRLGLRLVMPTEQDVKSLTDYSWPGNVRELAAVIDRAAILGNGERLEIAKALGVGGVAVSVARKTEDRIDTAGRELRSVLPLNDVIRNHIETALKTTKGRIEGPHGCALLLGTNPHTLRAKMRKLGINWRQFRG